MPKAKRVVWSPAAMQDLRDMWAYYVRVASAEIADKILLEIARTGEAIGERPLLSRDRGELMVGMRSVVVQPHVIFFRIGGEVVEIVRVLHGGRDFPAVFAGE